MDSVTTTALNPPMMVYKPVKKAITITLVYMSTPNNVFNTMPPARKENAIWITTAEMMEIKASQSLQALLYLFSNKSGKVATLDLM